MQNDKQNIHTDKNFRDSNTAFEVRSTIIGYTVRSVDVYLLPSSILCLSGVSWIGNDFHVTKHGV